MIPERQIQQFEEKVKFIRLQIARVSSGHLDLVEFKLDVQDLLGCDLDVVTENGLSPYLRRTILRTAKPLE